MVPCGTADFAALQHTRLAQIFPPASDYQYRWNQSHSCVLVSHSNDHAEQLGVNARRKDHGTLYIALAFGNSDPGHHSALLLLALIERNYYGGTFEGFSLHGSAFVLRTAVTASSSRACKGTPDASVFRVSCRIGCLLASELEGMRV
jgi:hypothetical protein